MNQRNYQRELDRVVAGLEQNGQVPRLLLHSCCAPCSSYVLEYLSKYFEITIYYYNPNIYPAGEYKRRIEELERLIKEMEFMHPVAMQAGAFEPDEFYRTVRGHEEDEEGGNRCLACYELRLREAAKVAAAGRFDYFTTTLSISPKKKAVRITEIGESLGEEYGVAYLPADFKKRDGFNRSLELSEEHGLYRQDYCGCVFSKRRREQNKE